jgi:hypothetical protein
MGKCDDDRARNLPIMEMQGLQGMRVSPVPRDFRRQLGYHSASACPVV